MRGEAPETVQAAVPGQVFVVLYSTATVPLPLPSPVNGAVTLIWLHPAATADAVPAVVSFGTQDGVVNGPITCGLLPVTPSMSLNSTW